MAAAADDRKKAAESNVGPESMKSIRDCGNVSRPSSRTFSSDCTNPVSYGVDDVVVQRGTSVVRCCTMKNESGGKDGEGGSEEWGTGSDGTPQGDLTSRGTRQSPETRCQARKGRRR